MAVKNPFPQWTQAPERRPTPTQFLRAARKSWFVRMAQLKGFVPARGASEEEKRALIYATLTGIFHWEEDLKKSYLKHMPWKIAADNGFVDLIPMSVMLPSTRIWLPVEVKASNADRAKVVLEEGLPDGTKIRERDAS